jgi:hypothetical protein
VQGRGQIAWRAQLGLTSRYRKLSARKLALSKIIVLRGCSRFHLRLQRCVHQ